MMPMAAGNRGHTPRPPAFAVSEPRDRPAATGGDCYGLLPIIFLTQSVSGRVSCRYKIVDRQTAASGGGGALIKTSVDKGVRSAACGLLVGYALSSSAFNDRDKTMALPSRDQTFAYESCRDLVEKLDREIGRYREVAGNNEDLDGEALLNLVHQLTDAAFNASVTSWHLCDWVFNDRLPPV